MRWGLSLRLRIQVGFAENSARFLEAAKFVGPLIAPVSGTITVWNEMVLAHPGLVNQDPLEHPLIEVELERPREELPNLLLGPAAVRAWFEKEIERFKTRGMVAE